MRLVKRTPKCPHSFLARVFRHHAEGFHFIAAKGPDSSWTECAIPTSEPGGAITRFLERYDAHRFDLYFCANVFSRKQRQTCFCLATHFAWCDIDDGVVEHFDPPPTFLIRTSPSRHQGLWEFERPEAPAKAEAFSRHLAYGFGGDKNGWSCTKYLRIPFTFNHKPSYDMPEVKLLRCAKPMKEWPEIEVQRRRALLDNTVFDPEQYTPEEVLQRYRKRIRYDRLSLMKHKAVLSRDRSRCIFMIVATLHEAGALAEEIAAVVWVSPYFQSKHGPCRHKLAEEISRIRSKLDAP